ncbi:DUF885 family protein, partial [candidate division WOR-3 bacterium]|nr:DUF885 family protein [candidate division WOR-3 bacterium]
MVSDKARIYSGLRINGPAIILLSLVASMAFGQLPQRTADIETIFRNFLIEYVELRPETGTAVGLPAAYRTHIDNGALDDESDAGLDRLYDLYRKYHRRLSGYCRDDLSDSQRAAAELLIWYLENELRGEEFRNHAYIINPMLGFHNSFTTLMTEHHRIESEADALDYIERLKGVRKKVSQLARRLEKQRTNGIIPPACIVEDYRQLLSEFIQMDCASNPLYTSFAARIDKVEKTTGRSRQKLCDQVIAALETSVYPAYRLFIEHIDVVHQAADDRAGVWKLPAGDAYYRYCLRTHTTTDLTPEQIHDLGINEVNRIQALLMDEFRKIGIPGSNDFAGLLSNYKQVTGDPADEQYYFPNTKQGKAQTLRAYQAAIDTM